MSNFNFDFDSNVDDDFFGSLKSKSSKLQQVFDSDTLPEDEKHQSLKYQRPKVSETKDSPKNDTSTVHTLIAKVAMAYRQRQNQGKVGVALVRAAENSFQIILYKSKENVLATLQLDSEKQTLFKQERYWQFYDDNTNMDWSYCFDMPEDDEQFKDVLQQHNQRFYESVEEMEEEVGESLSYTSITHGDTAGVDLSKKPSTSLDQIKISAKTSLIERMAKMGQPLPNLSQNSKPTPNTDPSDSSDVEVVTTSHTKPSVAPRSNKHSSFKVLQKHTLPTSTMALQETPVFSTNTFEAHCLQMLLSEQRIHGSEMRMNVSRLDSKVEKILDKVEMCIDRGAGGDPKVNKHRDDEILELEEKILNLKKENRKLKQALEAFDGEESFNIKSRNIIQRHLGDLLDCNLKESNDLEQILQDCIESLYDRNVKISKQQKIMETMEKRLKVLEDEKNMKGDTESLENQLLDEQQNVNLLKLDLSEKIKLIKCQQQQIQSLNQMLAAKSCEKEQPPLEIVVKTIMNNLYADICSKITPSVCGDMEMVLSLVEAAIKKETFKALKPQLPEEKDL